MRSETDERGRLARHGHSEDDDIGSSQLARKGQANRRQNQRDEHRPGELPGKRQRHVGDRIFSKGVALVQIENVRPEPAVRRLHQQQDSRCQRHRSRRAVDQAAPNIHQQEPEPKANPHHGCGLLGEKRQRDGKAGQRGTSPAPTTKREPKRECLQGQEQRVGANQIVEVASESEAGRDGTGAAETDRRGNNLAAARVRFAEAGNDNQSQSKGKGDDRNDATEQVTERQQERQNRQQGRVQRCVQERNEIDRWLDINALAVGNPLRVKEHAAFHPFEIEGKRRAPGEKSRLPDELREGRHGKSGHRRQQQPDEELFPAARHAQPLRETTLTPSPPSPVPPARKRAA